MVYDIEGVLIIPLQQQVRATLRPRPETCAPGDRTEPRTVQYKWFSSADIIHPWTVPHTWLQTVLAATGEEEPQTFPGSAPARPF